MLPFSSSWYGGRSFLSAVSLKDRQTWMPIGSSELWYPLSIVGSTPDRIYRSRASCQPQLIDSTHCMEVTYPYCAGLDVHKKTVVACCPSHLTHLDFLEEQIAVFDAKIIEHIQSHTPPSDLPAPGDGSSIAQLSSTPDLSSSPTAPSWEQSIALLDTIPGVGRHTAELLIAEIGSDMSRFKSAAHLAKWARLCPGNYESAGKRYSGRTGQANRWLRSGLVQAAHAAVKCKGTYLSAVYRRLAARRGVNKAIIAVAHRILTAAYYILLKQEPYQDLGANYLDERRKESVITRICTRIKQLGYQVNLEPIPTSAV